MGPGFGDGLAAKLGRRAWDSHPGLGDAAGRGPQLEAPDLGLGISRSQAASRTACGNHLRSGDPGQPSALRASSSEWLPAVLIQVGWCGHCCPSRLVAGSQGSSLGSSWCVRGEGGQSRAADGLDSWLCPSPARSPTPPACPFHSLLPSQAACLPCPQPGEGPGPFSRPESPLKCQTLPGASST